MARTYQSFRWNAASRCCGSRSSCSQEAENHIRFLAHYDALTGLPNRVNFNKKLDQEIEAALAMGRRLAVLCLDLDRFKEINDLFGHAAGDRALQSVAKRISGVLDENQLLARLGGDEFAIIAPGLSLPTIAGRIAETILEALQSAGAKRGREHGNRWSYRGFHWDCHLSR